MECVEWGDEAGKDNDGGWKILRMRRKYRISYCREMIATVHASGPTCTHNKYTIFVYLHQATSKYLYYKVSTVSGRCKPV